MLGRYINNEFRIGLKVQRSVVALLVALLFSSFFTAATVYAEKSKEQTAEELLYGAWFAPGGTEAKYSFNANNLKIVDVGAIDPKGESKIAVSLKISDGSWTTNNIVCWVTWENDHYAMYLIRRTDKGNEIQGDDCNVKYTKTKPYASTKSWAGTFVRDSNPFETANLQITAATNGSFDFSLNACSGGHVGMVSGTAKIVGNTAVFDDGKGNVLHFNLQDGGQITIEQSGEMQGYAATGVVFKGLYASQAEHKPAVEDKSYFTEQKVFKDDQEAIFKKIVGDNYTKFKNTAQLFSYSEDLDHSGARVYVMDVRGLFTIMESIIMVRDSDNSIWAAVIDADGKKVLYFTNTKDVKDIPMTIRHWNDSGNKYPICYVPAP